jgi:adenine-specific DNA-methyltransferase
MLQVCRAASRKLPVVVTVGDSLKHKPSNRDRFDLVIGNPPYGRVKLSSEDRQRFKRSLYGHANLYGLFTDLALSHVSQGGVVAYVTPTSFLAGEYFKNLRAIIGKEACPLTADFVALRKGVFEDVLQETLLATYRRGVERTPAQCFELLTGKNGEIQITPAGTFSLPVDASQPWLLPRTPDQATLIRRLHSMSHRLADWGYSVSTGPLVWNRFKPQMRARHVRGSLPLIWAEAVTSEGRFMYRADKRNHAPYFLPTDGVDDWLITQEPCVLLQRTTAKEQHRRLIAAALPLAFIKEHGGVVIENHLNMVRPTRKKPAISSETLAAFLNSAAADRAFRCVSGSVAVSAYEIENIPLPNPDMLKSLEQLVKQQASRTRIEDECSRLFDGAVIV